VTTIDVGQHQSIVHLSRTISAIATDDDVMKDYSIKPVIGQYPSVKNVIALWDSELS